MTTKYVLVFDEDAMIRDLLVEMAQEHLGSNFQVIRSGKVEEAKRLTTEFKPVLVLTEAIPTLDIRSPTAISPGDPGLDLISHIRDYTSSGDTPWLMVFMSRLPEHIPQDFKALVGERGSLFVKPPNIEVLELHLDTLGTTLLR